MKFASTEWPTTSSLCNTTPNWDVKLDYNTLYTYVHARKISIWPINCNLWCKILDTYDAGMKTENCR